MLAGTLAFVIGVWLLQQQAHLPEAYLGVLLLPFPLLLYGLRRCDSTFWRGVRLMLRTVFWLYAGFFWAALVAQGRLADALSSAWEGRDIELSGVVSSLPMASGHGPRFEFDVEHVSTANAHVPAHIQLTWFDGAFGRPSAHPPPVLHPGERWRFTVRLRRPHGNVNANGFDYEAWLLERGIRATGYVRDVADNRRLTPWVWGGRYLVEAARERAATRIARALGERHYAGVLTALAIGEQNAITPAQWQVFLRTGVNHLMSISGLHVTMVSSLLFAVVYWLWRRSPRLTLWLPARKAAVAAGIAAAGLYTLLSGFGVPAQRTFYMLGVMGIALWLGKTGKAFDVLAVALLTVLVLDPWAVMSPGFWLSFGAVGVIFYIAAGRVGESHWLAASARVQWAVTLGLVPALLALFQQVSLISPVANALAIPVVSFVVTPLTLAGTVLPLDFLLLAAHQTMVWCMAFLSWLSAAPGAVWQQHGPPPWTVLAGIAGVAWLLSPRGFPARWLGAVWLAPMFLVRPPGPGPGELWVSVLDVGQGSAVLLRSHAHALLYDTGPRYGADSDAGSRIVVPYLRGNGVERLDALVVSHDDSDHSGGAASVLRGIPVGWTAASLAGNTLPEAKPLVPCIAGQRWEWDGVRFEMLYPAAETYRDKNLPTNARCCVLKASSAFGSVLLPADTEKDAERRLVARDGERLSASVVVVPHHGSRYASSDAFVSAVHPRWAIFSVGYRNRFGHPTEEVVERYRASGARIFRTDQSGAALLRFTADGIDLQGQRQVAPRYWQDSPEQGGPPL